MSEILLSSFAALIIAVLIAFVVGVPHSLRNILMRLGERICHSPEEFKVWSLNLGHEGVLTTFYSNGSVATMMNKMLKTKVDRAIGD